jgi:ABC-type phosphate/phosphonate transport system substrate-binding protein
MHPAASWSEPELVIGQTCGWPYANYLKEQVVPFARFHYDLPDCPTGHYNSVYIGHDDDDFDHIASSSAFEFIEKIAINSDDSQSGFQVFSEITGEPAEESIAKAKRVVTGAHRNSISAVANGDANIAAIDAVAFELAKQYEPEAVSRVVVLGNSRPVPGLPLITSKANQELVPYLYEALQDALDDTPQDILQTLFILGAVKAEPSDYDDFKVEEPL